MWHDNWKTGAYSDSLFYDQLQNILDFKFDGYQSGSFPVISKYFVQMEQYCARLI